MKNKARFSFITLVVVIMPLLNVYATPIKSFGFGGLLVLLCLPFVFFNHNIISRVFNQKNALFIAFYFYSVFITLINIVANGYSLMDGLIRLLVESFYVVTIIVISSSGSFDFEKCKKYYKFFAFLVSSVLIIQTIAFYVFSKNLFFLIPNLKYNQSSLSTYEVYSATYSNMYNYDFRPTSVFLEPSHAALFLCPFLLITLFSGRFCKRDFLSSIFISIAIFLTTAGSGILIMVALWAIFIIKFFVVNQKYRVRTIALAFAFILFFALFVSQTSFFTRVTSFLYSRINDVGSGSASSINIRLLKGFEFYGNLPLFEKIFGMGMGTYDSYISIHSYSSQLFASEYMNSISYVLCSSGIIGSLLFLLFIYKSVKLSKSPFKKEIVVVMGLMYLTGSTLYSSYDFIIFILLLSPMLFKNEALNNQIRNSIYLNKSEAWKHGSQQEKNFTY